MLHCLSPLNITVTNYQRQSTCKEKRFRLASASEGHSPRSGGFVLWFYSESHRNAWQKKPLFITSKEAEKDWDWALSVPRTSSPWVWCIHLCACRHVHSWRQRLVSGIFLDHSPFYLFIYFKLSLLKRYFLLNCVVCTPVYVYVWVCTHELVPTEARRGYHISI